MKLKTVVVAIICGVFCSSGITAQDATPTNPFPFYGTVSGNNVRLRGGPGDFNAVLSMMEEGTIVRVNALEEPWYEIEIPGGLALYVCGSEGERVYVAEESPGRGVVRASNLHVRGTQGTEHPPLGKLDSGDRVVILDGKDNWFRIMAPPGTKAFVHKDFVKPAADQKVAKALFAMKHVDAARRLMETGASSKQMLAAEAKTAVRKKEAEKTFKKYESEGGKGAGTRDIAGVRKDLMRVRDATPKNDPDRARAQALIDTLEEWARLKKDHLELERKRRQVEQEANVRYSKEMEDLKRYVKEQREKEAGGNRVDKRINGWVRRIFPVKGIQNPISNFAVYRGNERQYLLVSDRYDLADFTDKLVVVLDAEEPEKRAGSELRVVRVNKLEILGIR